MALYCERVGIICTGGDDCEKCTLPDDTKHATEEPEPEVPYE